MNNSHEALINLMGLMERHFNSGELQQLCFQLAVEYEDIPKPNQQGKIRELIQYMNRHSRLCELVKAVGKTRPKSIEELNKIAGQLGCALVEPAPLQDEEVAQGEHITEVQIVQKAERPLPLQENKTPQNKTINSNLQIVNRMARPLATTVTAILQTIFTNC